MGKYLLKLGCVVILVMVGMVASVSAQDRVPVAPEGSAIFTSSAAAEQVIAFLHPENWTVEQDNATDFFLDSGAALSVLARYASVGILPTSIDGEPVTFDTDRLLSFYFGGGDYSRLEAIELETGRIASVIGNEDEAIYAVFPTPDIFMFFFVTGDEATRADNEGAIMTLLSSVTYGEGLPIGVLFTSPDVPDAEAADGSGDGITPGAVTTDFALAAGQLTVDLPRDWLSETLTSESMVYLYDEDSVFDLIFIIDMTTLITVMGGSGNPAEINTPQAAFDAIDTEGELENLTPEQLTIGRYDVLQYMDVVDGTNSTIFAFNVDSSVLLGILNIYDENSVDAVQSQVREVIASLEFAPE